MTWRKLHHVSPCFKSAKKNKIKGNRKKEKERAAEPRATIHTLECSRTLQAATMIAVAIVAQVGVGDGGVFLHAEVAVPFFGHSIIAKEACEVSWDREEEKVVNR